MVIVKRRVRNLLVLLLLGVIVNVAVAWGCGIFPAMGEKKLPCPLDQQTIDSIWKDHADASWPSAPSIPESPADWQGNTDGKWETLMRLASFGLSMDLLLVSVKPNDGPMQTWG